MSLKKQYLKSKPVCKVTFTLPRHMTATSERVFLVGEFNGWDVHAQPMKHHKNGDFNLSVNLETGHEYQFRYLLDGTTWQNDEGADKYVRSSYGDCDNSVVVV